jgi:hypothetical protein
MRLRHVRALIECILNRGIQIQRSWRQHWFFRRNDVHCPEVRLLRIHNQRAKHVFERLHLGFTDDHSFFVARDFRLRFDDVDGRDGADLDPSLVVLERFLRKSQRFLRHFQLSDGTHEIVVGVPNGA